MSKPEILAKTSQIELNKEEMINSSVKLKVSNPSWIGMNIVNRIRKFNSSKEKGIEYSVWEDKLIKIRQGGTFWNVKLKKNTEGDIIFIAWKNNELKGENPSLAKINIKLNHKKLPDSVKEIKK